MFLQTAIIYILINDNTAVLQVQYNTSQQCAVIVSWVLLAELPVYSLND